MRYHHRRSDIFFTFTVHADFISKDPDQGQRDSVRQRHHVLQGGQCYPRRGKRGRLQRVLQAAGRHHSEECPGYDDPGRDIVTERDRRY